MKINGKNITKEQYDSIASSITPIAEKDRLKLKQNVYDELGREIHNPKPVFINNPDDSERPLTLDDKLMRILRVTRERKLQQQFETSEEMEDFGETPEEDMTTPYQVVDLKDDLEITKEDLDELEKGPKVENGPKVGSEPTKNSDPTPPTEKE